MIEKSKKCGDVVKKKKIKNELVMTKEDDEDFENYTKCCVCGNAYVDGDVKVRDHHCYKTGK